MYTPSNSKIEDRAIGALSNLIDDHQTMGHQFNSMDKEMSWDGYIWIFKNVNGSQNKDNYDDKVPVQIKGHIDEKEKYCNKKRITYPVALEDLEVYFRDRGVLYFEIFMSRDGKRREIFYASLFPTKLKYYLDNARKKQSKKNINITFVKVEKKSDVFYNVVKQFSNESKKQGFGHEQLVQNAIKVADIGKVKEITASVVGASDEYEFIKKLGTGDVSFYAKLEGTPFSVPVEWQEDSVYYIEQDVNKKVSVAGKQFYDSYKITLSSREEMTIILSDNVQISMSKGKFTFTPNTDIKTLRRDAEFLLAEMKNENFTIEEQVFPIKNVQMPETLYQKLQFFIKLDELLSQIQFEYTKPFPEIAESTIKKFTDLIALQEGKKNNLFTENVHTYDLEIDGKYIPLIVFKNEQGGRNNIYNAVYSTSCQTAVADDKGNYYRVPILSHIKGHVMRNLFKYDANVFEKQIFEVDFNLITESSMNMAGLSLIHAYDGDEEHDPNLLKIADRLYTKLIKMFGEKNIYIINKMQIKKRQNLFGAKEIEVLSKMKCDDEKEKCGKYILLGDEKMLKQSFGQLCLADKEEFKTYPIYMLHMEHEEKVGMVKAN